MTTNGSTLIIGASSTFGLGLAKSLLSDGGRVVAHYHNSKTMLDELGAVAKDGQLNAIRADLKSNDEVIHLIQAIKNLEILVEKIVFFASPKLKLIRFKAASWDDFQEGIQIELRTQFLICREFLPLMASRGRGKVVFVLSSVTQGVPPRSMAQYTTLKYASLGLMRALASEYSGKGVMINGVSPAMAATPFLDHIPSKVAEIACEQHPLKRLATTEDIVPFIRMLISDECTYVTGTNIPITGGLIF
jgi:3-oxoacyl-[acyl-carrier protein] reductase